MKNATNKCMAVKLGESNAQGKRSAPPAAMLVVGGKQRVNKIYESGVQKPQKTGRI